MHKDIKIMNIEQIIIIIIANDPPFEITKIFLGLKSESQQ